MYAEMRSSRQSAAVGETGPKDREQIERSIRRREGIHVGEIDRRGDDVSGLAINVAA
jgi:hypothetical protein